METVNFRGSVKQSETSCVDHLDNRKSPRADKFQHCLFRIRLFNSTPIILDNVLFHKRIMPRVCNRFTIEGEFDKSGDFHI